MEPGSAGTGAGSGRGRIIRDVLVFQGKLVVDGFRDVVLLPVSLIAAIFSLIGKGKAPSSEFYDLLRLAKRSERWINLFGAVEKRTAGSDDEAERVRDLDALVSRVETFLVDEYNRGGVTAQAKARMHTALDSLRGMRKRIGPGKAA